MCKSFNNYELFRQQCKNRENLLNRFRKFEDLHQHLVVKSGNGSHLFAGHNAAKRRKSGITNYDPEKLCQKNTMLQICSTERSARPGLYV
jgi:hypothetical protein